MILNLQNLPAEFFQRHYQLSFHRVRSLLTDEVQLRRRNHVIFCLHCFFD